MSGKTTTPGMSARWKIITDNCRGIHGDESALDIALTDIREEMLRCLRGYPMGRGAKFHIVATVEYPEGSRRATPKDPGQLTENDLIYAAYTRCRCGAGMAYKKDESDSRGSWQCSEVLLGRAKGEEGAEHADPMPFPFYKVKSENQPSANGATTRPKKEDAS